MLKISKYYSMILYFAMILIIGMIDYYSNSNITFLLFYEVTIKALNEKSEIYRDLKSIGYTKRILKLDSDF